MRIGVDLGGTKVEGIRLKDNGQIDKKIRVSTPTKNYDSVITSICNLISDLQTPDRISVGIGTPGTLDPQTNFMKNSDSLCINGSPFKKDIEESDLGLTFIENLKPVKYKIKEKNILQDKYNSYDTGGVRTHYGLISQDVRDCLKKMGKKKRKTFFV